MQGSKNTSPTDRGSRVGALSGRSGVGWSWYKAPQRRRRLQSGARMETRREDTPNSIGIMNISPAAAEPEPKFIVELRRINLHEVSKLAGLPIERAAAADWFGANQTLTTRSPEEWNRNTG